MRDVKRSQEIDLGICRCVISPDKKIVTFIGAGKPNGLTAGTPDFLSAAVGFLSTSAVQKRASHAALLIEWTPILFSSEIKKRLAEHAVGYQDKFGVPSEKEKESRFIINEKGDRAKRSWGDGVATITLDKIQDTITLETTLGRVPTELMADICVALIRDPYTADKYPNFSASHLRGWGEDAFNIDGLKPGFPKTFSAESPSNSSAKRGVGVREESGEDPRPLNRTSKTGDTAGQNHNREASQPTRERTNSGTNWLKIGRAILKGRAEGLTRWQDELSRRAAQLEDAERVLQDRQDDLRTQKRQAEEAVRRALDLARQNEQEIAKNMAIKAKIEALLKKKFDLE